MDLSLFFIPLGLLLFILLLALLLWAIFTGQMDEGETPKFRILFDEERGADEDRNI